MLQLKEITKVYETENSKVQALNGISLDFRKSEFVAILGPSGCGKTTLLNIIGGLDHYTSGDLIINSKSTKNFKDADWDAYRNHSIGFIFQSYNLIPHQSVLKNVELALTLSGVSPNERRQRAIDALEMVGLHEQINKRPNQLSGGQMQRVAIARSLVNNPDILLADEPTGALDTKTSIQIMDILKEVAKDRLVIMVTHNPDLANTYANRIITILDGKITSDSREYNFEEDKNDGVTEDASETESNVEKKEGKKDKKKKNRVSMSFFTALSLSLNNLLTKKARTILVAFAGSIGIIGIALILSVSSGFQDYINKVQEDTLSTYPLVLQSQSVDYSSLMENFLGKSEEEIEHEEGKVYSRNVMANMMSTMLEQSYKNDLASFKIALDEDEEIKDSLTAVKYTYDLPLNIYKVDDDNFVQISPSNPVIDAFSSSMGMDTSSSLMGYSMGVLEEMIDNEELIKSQYDLIYGDWPKAYNEILLLVNAQNELSDYVLYMLGIKDVSEISAMMSSMARGESFEAEVTSYTFEELCSYSYKLVFKADYYYLGEDGLYHDISDDMLEGIVRSGVDLKISGIIRPNKYAAAHSLSNPLVYTNALTKYMISETLTRPAVKAQLENKNINIFNGMPFIDGEIDSAFIYNYIDSLDPDTKLVVQAYITLYGEEYVAKMINEQSTTLDSNLSKLGVVDEGNPSSISLYPVDFSSKELILDFIDRYNEEQDDEDKITYTDYVGILLNSITQILNAVTAVLIAFVAISLVVSSIMIGIITYISVFERIKEIGILRSIGASKKDISNVFNAETLIIGFTSGMFGILITLIICIPINFIINLFAEIGQIAKLPFLGAIILVLLSMSLSLIAGLIPSGIAARRDPVEALRSE